MKKVFEHRDAKIHYQIVGTGNPVLLLHGFGEDADIWEYQIEFLKAQYQLIVPHLPGSGPSTAPHYGLEYLGMDAMAGMANDLLGFEGIEKAVVLGHSMGGYTAMAMAELFPTRLSGLGLIHSSAYADGEEKKAARQKSIDLIGEQGSAAFLKTAIPGLFGPTYTEHYPERIAALLEKISSVAPEVLQGYYRAMMARPDRTAALKAAPYPVLFVVGEHDKAVPKADMLVQAAVPKQAAVTLLNDAGHMGMLEEAENMNQAILKYLLEL